MRLLVVTTWLCVLLPWTDAQARDWYVSAARGEGRTGTKAKPAKDLGNIASKLAPGDVVHVAAGIYLGKGKSGADEIVVPVSIIGGYDETFSRRDPWGSLRSIMSGDHATINYRESPRVFINLQNYRGAKTPSIVVDGLVIDQGAQNKYWPSQPNSATFASIPELFVNPSPRAGGLVIQFVKPESKRPDVRWRVTVKNNIILNSAAAEGCLQVSAAPTSEVVVANNVVLNCGSTGIVARSSHIGKIQPTNFHVHNNTILFTWRIYPGEGDGLSIDPDVKATVERNVIGFSDRFNIAMESTEPLLLRNNVLLHAVSAAYYEGPRDSKMQLDDLKDEAELLHDDSAGNTSFAIRVPVSQQWKQLYELRVLPDQQAGPAHPIDLSDPPVTVHRTPVMLHRMSVDDALSVAQIRIVRGAGAQKPRQAKLRD